MRFSLIPREMKFFDLFDAITATLNSASTKFLDMLTEFDNLPARGLDIKQEEEKCDSLVEKTLRTLDQTFITPFDREDIHRLATTLDDVLDSLEETAHRFEVFRIDKPTRASISLASIIKESTLHLERAIRHLRNMRKVDEIQKSVLLVGQLENEADRLYREVDAALFDDANAGDDILSIIKWRELYGWLEQTVDSCKEVANVISEIVIKGS